MTKQIVTWALNLFLLAGCCSGTTVVLIPNDVTGKVGEVTMKTKAGTQTLTKANESTEASTADQVPDQPEALTEKEIYAKFGEVLAKQPHVPLHYTLLFGSGVPNIAPEYKPLLKKIAAAINERKTCFASAIGHSDTVGDYQSNHELSKKRAENVRNALIELGVPSKCIDERDYGEHDLAKETLDNVAWPANRRVEVEIR